MSLENNNNNFLFLLRLPCDAYFYLSFFFLQQLRLVFTFPIDQYENQRGSMTVTNSIKSDIFVFCVFFWIFFNCASLWWSNWNEKQWVRTCLCTVWFTFFLLCKKIFKYSFEEIDCPPFKSHDDKTNEKTINSMTFHLKKKYWEFGKCIFWIYFHSFQYDSLHNTWRFWFFFGEC